MYLFMQVKFSLSDKDEQGDEDEEISAAQVTLRNFS